jgi:hypothetical protein
MGRKRPAGTLTSPLVNKVSFADTPSVSAYLLPIAFREALTWIVSEQQTALPRHRAGDAAAVEKGDTLFLYATRGCFGNPTRDRGRVFAAATVTARAAPLQTPVRFGDREYGVGLAFEINLLAPIREGVELALLVRELATFPDPDSWSARLRRALVPLAPGDAEILLRELRDTAPPYPMALGSYV